MKTFRAFSLFLVAVMLCGAAWGQVLTLPDGTQLNDYYQVYGLDLNNVMGGDLDAWGATPYTVDNSSRKFGPIESIAYVYQLNNSTNNNWVFASMDAFTSNPAKMGLPTKASGAVFQEYVSNLNVRWNAPGFNLYGANTGNTTFTQGNIEFWPTNYETGNDKNIPGASNDSFDHGDKNSWNQNYGSMQIHALGNSTYSGAQTVLAFNRWGGATGNNPADYDVGIGSRTTDYPDWTFARNSGDYSTKQLDVYVKRVSMAEGLFENPTVAAEIQNMNLVYKMDIPTTKAAGGMTAADYTYNNAAAVATELKGFPLKVGYYMELTRSDAYMTANPTAQRTDYVYVSMDGLTNDVSKTGLPFNDAYYHQKTVQNMTVQSNVAGVVNGTGIKTGNVEMWSGNYTEGNAMNVPNASGSTYDFGDSRGAGNGYSCFQVHNYGEKQTVFALNHWGVANHAGSSAMDIGIGNNPTGNPDWTFNIEQGANANINQYADRKLYVMASAAYAPGMANVANGSDFTMVRGWQINSAANANMHNGTSYFIDNAQQMMNGGVLFDRVGYYMEYVNPSNPEDLYYAFVSMDAFQLSGNSQVTGMAKGDWMQNLTKLGVPDATAGTIYQQYVKNLEITTNLPSSEGTLTLGTETSGQRSGTAKTGFLEFWPSNYGQGQATGFSHGNGGIFDTNDSGYDLGAGHGSMQIHNLDTNQTVIAMNGFGQAKKFGIGSQPGGGDSDWTHDAGKAGYEIANMYMFVRESDAVMATMDAASGYAMYQRGTNGNATVDISGAFLTREGTDIAKIQFSLDGGQTWSGFSNLQLDKTAGTFSGDVVLGTGWHSVDLRALDAGGSVLTSISLGDKIGVGEIFITAGQSNSANHGDALLQTKSGNVLAMDPSTGQWNIANDPQPYATAGWNQGSTWPSFGDTLSDMLSKQENQTVPVGIVSVGVGGTTIDQWNTGLDQRLLLAIQALDSEFAGILWHQGESDFWTDGNTYKSGLEKLIQTSRDAVKRNQDGVWTMAEGLPGEWDVPWLIALVSALGDGSTSKAITDAQRAIIEDDLFAFLGPDSDWVKNIENPLGSGFYPYRGINGNDIHFSELGQEYMGLLWALSAYDMIQARNSLGTPEPATWAMMMLGIAGLAVLARRKRKTAA